MVSSHRARPLNGLDRPGMSKCVAAKVVDGNNVTDSVITSPEKNDMISNVIKPLPEELPKTVPHPKKKKRVNNFLEYGDDGIENGCLNRNEETPGINAKESLEEKEEQPKAKRDDNFSNIQADALPHFTVRTPTLGLEAQGISMEDLKSGNTLSLPQKTSESLQISKELPSLSADARMGNH